MTFCLTLLLYGPADALETARGIVENMPQVRRVDCSADGMQMRLLLSERLGENSLIPLLAPSGVSGFRLIDQ